MQTFKKKWNGFNFTESGTRMGPDGKSLARSFHNLMKRVCAKIGAKVVKAHTGHYDVSGFIQRKDGSLVYYIYGDFRLLGRIDVYACDACRGVCLRTVKSTTDYKGGGLNNFSSIANLETKIPQVK